MLHEHKLFKINIMLYTLVDKFLRSDFTNLILDNLKKESNENINN